MKIIKTQKGLEVPSNPTIPFIEGDGIGQDITGPSLAVLDKAILRAYGKTKSIDWLEVYAGQKGIEKKDQLLPQETLDAFKEYLVGIKGPLMTPVGKGFRSINVTLRQQLDLYVCLRPVRWFTGVPSPMKHPEYTDMVVFRENTEDIYAGIEFDHGTPAASTFYEFIHTQLGINNVRFPNTSSFGVKPVSKEGSERLIRAAIQYAIDHNRTSVTLVHKGNIMKFTEGGFKRWGYAMAQQEFSDQVFTLEEYNTIKENKGVSFAEEAMAKAISQKKIIVKDVIADAFLQETLLHPQEYDVIATLNLNGDYVSDQLAATVGGIGIAPGGNINYNNGIAIFEATHGTAPNIVGTGKANPCSMILSGAMLLEYIGWNEAAEYVYKAIESTIAKKVVTSDLGALMDTPTIVSTEAFALELCNSIEDVLSTK